MSEPDENLTPDQQRKLAAAEYVLGVLPSDEHAAIGSRLQQEPDLAGDVAFWEERLTPLANDIPSVVPPSDTWSGIETRLGATPPRQRVAGGLWDSLIFWRGFSIASTAAALALAVLAYPGAQRSARPAALVAALGEPGGQLAFVASLASDGDSLVIVPAARPAGSGYSLELWLVPPGDRPQSLGLISSGQPLRLTLPPRVTGRMTIDAVLAVSQEPPGGSPTGLPTGPIIANGKLTGL